MVLRCSFVYGEGLYAEVFGDTPSAYLPAEQLQLAADVRAVADARGVPVIGVYVGGRDRLLAQFEALFDSHLAAFFPGPFGGAAIADTIAGVHCPCARLPITLHMADKQSLPYWHNNADYASIPASLDDMSPRCAVTHLCTDLPPAADAPPGLARCPCCRRANRNSPVRTHWCGLQEGGRAAPSVWIRA